MLFTSETAAQAGVCCAYLALLEAHEPDEAHLQQLAHILQPVGLLKMIYRPPQADWEGYLG